MSSTHSSTWVPVERPPPLFTLSQHNCLGSWDVFLSYFGSFESSLPHPPSLVALQDPQIFSGRLLSFPGYTSFAPPPSAASKQRVPISPLRALLDQVSLIPVFWDRSDLMAV